MPFFPLCLLSRLVLFLLIVVFILEAPGDRVKRGRSTDRMPSQYCPLVLTNCQDRFSGVL